MHRSILKQHLWVDAVQINTYNAKRQLTGVLQRIKNTPFDFTKPREIGERIKSTSKGYDNAYQLRHPDNMQKAAAILFDAQSGRAMQSTQVNQRSILTHMVRRVAVSHYSQYMLDIIVVWRK